MKTILTTIISLITLLELNAQGIISIDLTQAIFEEINAEKIFKEIEVIPLETHKDALLDARNRNYYLTDKYIIAVRFKGAYLFDRKTGAFIREVGSVGQGPNEYTGWIILKCGFDEKNNILFANNGAYYKKSWKGFNIETNKVEFVIKEPGDKNDNELFLASAPWRIKDNIYVSFCNNRTGKDKIKLVVYDNKENIIQKYPNYLIYDKKTRSYPADNGIFYHYNGSTYFKEWNYNDTVFRVTEKNITPHLIFKLGNKQPSYYHQEDADYNKGKYFINFVYESDAFVLFNFSHYSETTIINDFKSGNRESTHTGYYDKKSKRTYISSTPSLKKSGYTISNIPVSFYPISINKNKEIIAGISPEELIKHKEKINAPYKKLLQHVREDDNPIVIIAKLKD
jgi:hypothetical protein